MKGPREMRHARAYFRNKGMRACRGFLRNKEEPRVRWLERSMVYRLGNIIDGDSLEYVMTQKSSIE